MAFVEITKSEYDRGIQNLETISGGDMYGGGFFLEHGRGNYVYYRTEERDGVSRFFEYTGADCIVNF